MKVEVHKPPDGGGDSHPTGWAKPGVGERKESGEEGLLSSQRSVAMVMINPVGSGEAGLQRRDQSGEQGGDESIAASVDVSQVNMEERGAQAEGLDTAQILEEGRKRQA